MGLFWSMLPLYLFGNLHCLGMCGPLVMMIGHHRYRYMYFLGRTISFSLAGGLAGGIGAVSDVVFRHYHIGETLSFIFGFFLLLLGIFTLLKRPYPGYEWLARRSSGLNHRLSLLMLSDRAWTTFLFGFFTLMLPCGQTLIVFSACALSGDPIIGWANSLAFALLTSPSLFLAMRAHTILRKARGYYRVVVGVSALIVGSLAILRGIAESGWISHWVLNSSASSYYHLVIF